MGPSAQRAAGQPLKLQRKLSGWERAEEQRSHLLTCMCAQAHDHMHTNTHIHPGVLRSITRTPNILRQREAVGAPDFLFWGKEIHFPKSQPPLLSH